jgi:hypothetical protein
MDCDKIVTEYIRWIKDNTTVKAVQDGKACGVITPFLDRHNDHIEIYVSKMGDGYVLTDDGYTVADLKMSGLTLNSPKREKIFETILKGFGVKFGLRNELFVEANATNLGQKKHYLLQAILAVNDMYSLSQENVFSLFKEDVELFFKSNDIFYNRDVKLTGKSGFDHNIDFMIPASKKRPERLIRTVNNPKKDPIMAAIFSFADIQQVRSEATANFVIYNDLLDQPVSKDALSALANYSITSIPWSQKEKCKEEFSLN